jgi:hypothetical protein
MKLCGLVVALGLACIAATAPAATGQSSGGEEPRYTTDNRMLRPDNYREWVWLSSGLGMSYTPGPADENPGFDNVFVNPSAYRSFMATGKWPDKTVLVLETRSSVSKSSINRSGRVQGEMTGMEVHVKDERRFPGKWAFFGFGNSAKAGALVPTSASCYSCHKQHGAVDTTFVQFYPILMDIAKQKGTVQPGY